MRWQQLALMLGSMLALLSGFPPATSAFHEGGVGACDGCHDLHTSERNAAGLLRGADASSTCLLCHGGVGEGHDVLSHDGSSFNAGGDFYWLKQSYAWTEDGQPHASPADSHGHNVVALEFGLRPDGSLAVAPGGDYPASDLSCVSCHDPHGQRTGNGNGGIPISGPGSYQGASPEGTSKGNYRLLGGVGYSTSGTAFSNDAPVALAPPQWSETDESHVDYGSGMSEWCANCHEAALDGTSTRHPAGEAAVFTDQTATAYAAYIRSGNLSGSANSSYLALVPFERGVSDPSLLDPTSTAGPEPGVSNVMCLSCHRAHASAFETIGRWDLYATFLAESHPGIGDAGAGSEDVQNSYYGRNLVADFGSYQRSLCNKCHALD